jgi:hypothetical protein
MQKIQSIVDAHGCSTMPPLGVVIAHLGGRLSVQRRRQYLPGTIANDLVEQRLDPIRRSACVGGRPVMNYLEHGRTFPNQRANVGPDQSHGLSDHSPEGAPTHAASPRTIHRF